MSGAKRKYLDGIAQATMSSRRWRAGLSGVIEAPAARLRDTGARAIDPALTRRFSADI